MLTDRDHAYRAISPRGPALRRRENRLLTVLLIGRVRGSQGMSACLVHNISSHGLMARFTVAPTVGQQIRIKVRGLHEATATVRWVKDCHAGVEFDGAQDVAGVFQHADGDGRVIRAPRFPVDLAATLCIADRRIPVELIDISAGGTKFSCADKLLVGQAGQLRLRLTQAAVFGKLCWAGDGRYGFQFVAPLPLAVLAQILDC